MALTAKNKATALKEAIEIAKAYGHQSFGGSVSVYLAPDAIIRDCYKTITEIAAEIPEDSSIPVA